MDLCLGAGVVKKAKTKGFAYLEDFKMVKNLKIVKIIGHMEEIHHLLTTYLPNHFKKLTVVFPNGGGEQEPIPNFTERARNVSLLSASDNPSSQHLRRLELTNYTPIREDAVSYTIIQFAGLEGLTISGKDFVTPMWPSGVQISTETMITLFKFLLGLLNTTSLVM